MNKIKMELSRRGTLAIGSYSIVYRCKDKNSGKYYAVKRLMVSKTVSFCGSIREIDIIMAVQHPYVVLCKGLLKERAFTRPLSPMKEPYKDDGFLQVYDLYKNNLRVAMKDVGDVKEFAFKLLLGIEFIHGRDIVHRDLKPENVMIDEDNNPRIGDFGLSQRIQNNVGAECQTLNYRSPELIFGWEASTYDGRKTDIWAYGCILYELMNDGKMLFGSIRTDEEMILEMSKFADLTTIKEYGKKTYAITPRVQPLSDSIVRFILNPDPRQRPNATQVLDHPYFDSIRYSSANITNIRADFPIFPISMDTLDIRYSSKIRIQASDILININNRQRDNSSWFKYVILFHALEIIDRIILMKNRLVVKSIYVIVMSVLYILVKMFNEDQLRDPPTFKNFSENMVKVDKEYIQQDDKMDYSLVEYHLLNDILRYTVFKVTPYEYHIDNKSSGEFITPPGWSEMLLLFMMYTRMPDGKYHVSNVWRKARQLGRDIVKAGEKYDIVKIIDNINGS